MKRLKWVMSVNTSMVNCHISLFYKMIETLPKTKSTYYLRVQLKMTRLLSIIAIIQKFLKVTTRVIRKEKATRELRKKNYHYLKIIYLSI